jgi:hypothetical protein
MNHMGDLEADGRIIFKWNLQNQDVRTRTGIKCLRIWSGNQTPVVDSIPRHFTD